jgi:hypothetical protein
MLKKLVIVFAFIVGTLHAEEPTKEQPSTSVPWEISTLIESLTLEQTLYVLAGEQFSVVSEKMRIPYCTLRNAIEEELYDPAFGGIDREQFLHLFYHLMYQDASKEIDLQASPQPQLFFERLPNAHELEDIEYDISGEYVTSFDQLYLPKQHQSTLVVLVKQYSFREKLSYLLKGFLTEHFPDNRALFEKIGTVFGNVECSAFVRYPETYAQCYDRAQQLVAQHGTNAQQGLLSIIYTPHEHNLAVTEVAKILQNENKNHE